MCPSDDTSGAASDIRTPRSLLSRWHGTPLYIRIIGGLILGIVTGLLIGPRAHMFELPSKLILRLLGALAPMLILFTVMRALLTAQIHGRTARRLIGLLLLNTTVAITIGLTVANLIQPGAGTRLKPTTPAEVQHQDPLAPRVLAIVEAEGYALEAQRPEGPLALFLESIPKSLLGPLSNQGNVIGVIFIAIAFGIALRRYRQHPVNSIENVLDIGFGSLLVVLHWIIDLVPIGVFGMVASIIGSEGFAPFASLGWFIASVLLALSLQAVYYLTRIRLLSWVPIPHVMRGTRDALVMAFSTDSSTVTMPVTYECLKNNVGLREESASMGALVGANFNNDGTALYQAMSALFVSQILGIPLGLPEQLMVVLTAIIASAGAAGIPEAGLVTMTLIFAAVNLPTQYIALLLPVDWFLDRCRTTVNVMGDINVSCILDGKIPPSPASGTNRITSIDTGSDPNPNPSSAPVEPPAA